MTKSEKFWNRTAGRYNKKEKKEESTYGEYLAKLSKFLNRDDYIIDLGCGTGLISIGLAEKVNKILAVDTSSALIDIAEKNAAERNINNIDYKCISIIDSEYEDNCFDAILGLYVFHLVEDLSAVMNTLNRILKPGGIVISSTPCMGENNRLLGGILKIAGFLGIVPGVNILSLAGLKTHFFNAGFYVVETELIDKSGHQYFIIAKKI